MNARSWPRVGLVIPAENCDSGGELCYLVTNESEESDSRNNRCPTLCQITSGIQSEPQCLDSVKARKLVRLLYRQEFYSSPTLGYRHLMKMKDEHKEVARNVLSIHFILPRPHLPSFRRRSSLASKSVLLALPLVLPRPHIPSFHRRSNLASKSVLFAPQLEGQYGV